MCMFARRYQTPPLRVMNVDKILKSRSVHFVFGDARKCVAADSESRTVERKFQIINGKFHANLYADGCKRRVDGRPPYSPITYANIRGATIEASELIMNLGASRSSFHQVIFSFGTAPEYEPNEVVESEIWQK
jgi:hypothetical protein